MTKYEQQVRRLFNLYPHKDAEEIIQWLISIHEDALKDYAPLEEYNEDDYLAFTDRIGW